MALKASIKSLCWRKRFWAFSTGMRIALDNWPFFNAKLSLIALRDITSELESTQVWSHIIMKKYWMTGWIAVNVSLPLYNRLVDLMLFHNNSYSNEVMAYHVQFHILGWRTVVFWVGHLTLMDCMHFQFCVCVFFFLISSNRWEILPIFTLFMFNSIKGNALFLHHFVISNADKVKKSKAKRKKKSNRP